MMQPVDLRALISDCRASIAEADAVVTKIEQESCLRTAACTEIRAEKEIADGDAGAKSATPWELAGVSRRTWFRQQRRDRDADPYIPFLLSIWVALQHGDRDGAERIFVRMLTSRLPTTGNRHTIDAALWAAISHARKGARSRKNRPDEEAAELTNFDHDDR